MEYNIRDSNYSDTKQVSRLWISSGLMNIVLRQKKQSYYLVWPWYKREFWFLLLLYFTAHSGDQGHLLYGNETASLIRFESKQNRWWKGKSVKASNFYSIVKLFFSNVVYQKCRMWKMLLCCLSIASLLAHVEVIMKIQSKLKESQPLWMDNWIHSHLLRQLEFQFS